MTYSEAVALLASLAPRGWRLGLERMERFVDAAGLRAAVRPPRRFFHVAGTNGKGSVTAFAQSLLVAAGHRTGGFFSPYVVDPRERIQIGGELIAREEFARLAEELWPVAERTGEITEFEFKTAMGFLAWERAECEWVALEVGLGGRFDATNVVAPTVTAIVSISLDHTAILGRTEGEIAFEKAGIAKTGVPLLLGETIAGSALERILTVARDRGAPIGSRLTRGGFSANGLATIDGPAGRIEGVRLGLGGRYAADNAALAIDALRAGGVRLDAQMIRRGLEEARLPGRGDTRLHRGRMVLLDGAHNVGSADNVRWLMENAPGGALYGAVLVTNMLSGHDADAFFAAIAPVFTRAIVVPIDFPRALDPDEAATKLSRLGLTVTVAPSVKEGLRLASEEGPIVVTGSFYLVGEALRILDGVQDT